MTSYGVEEKKAFARQAISGWNPIEPTNANNTKAWFVVEASKILAGKLIDRDPLSIMTTDWDFSYADPINDNPNYISADDALALYRDAQRETSTSTSSTGFKIGGGPSFDSILNFDNLLKYDFQNFEKNFQVNAVQNLTYVNRNSEWPQWND